jgi:NAD(P)H-quinone oxidoreductase subunit 4
VLAILIIVLGIQPQWLARWSEPQAAVLLTGSSDIAALPIAPFP